MQCSHPKTETNAVTGQSWDQNTLLGSIARHVYIAALPGTSERHVYHFWLLHILQEQDRRYETALELLGERNEQVDQLEEDIAEMKEIFHDQLSMMADQLTAINAPEAALLSPT